MDIRKILNRPLYYRRDGTPYSFGFDGLLDWAKDQGNIENRRVAFDDLPNGIEVSTVWLGLDHNYGLQPRRPLIFETMLFVRQKSEVLGIAFDRTSIGEQWRYATEDEALRGHKMLVKKWSKFKTADQVLDELD